MKTLSTQSYLPAAEAPLAAGVRLENGMIPFLGEDTSFVIDRLEELEKGDADPTAGSLAGRLDLSRIGIAGVSLGGLVAGEVARADHRIVAALILDAPVPLRTVTTGLDVPTMWITRPPSTMRLERERSGGWPEDEIEAHHRTIRTTYDTLRAPGYIVQVPRISHIDFTDAPLWSPLVRWLRLSGPRDGRYAHRVITDHAMAFLEHHLRARALTPLDEQQADRLRAAHPGVTLELHHPPTD
ncbi:hypothetical protein [Raineyella sp. LH-20]|uniref:hypothetical protein n=1 Tax=Raineyella sp. LH-20 TaxID=3081204 RepID=UPI00295487CC|nr:hypothetical protein [Raineyella sp. LH-20]WOP18787.1 hypothetical protein R0146_00505 [Raineyella sp. LH-20]